MSGYRPPFSNNQYTNYPPPHPQPPNQPPYPPHYPPQQYPHQQYAPQTYPQQPQPQHSPYYPPPPPPPYSQPSAPSPGARGLEYSSYSAPLQSYSAPPPDSQPPPQQHPPPPQGMPPQMYWQPPGPMPGSDRATDQAARTAAGAVFDRFDLDKSGYLDLQEFMDALRALHLAITYHEALECFAQCDANEDGRIGKGEFVVEYMKQMKKRGF